MNRLNRFFWFCSGAHIPTLSEEGTEHNKYTGIGATIFFTAIFAALSGGYAMYFVFKGAAFAALYAILFGLLWGAAIFNMDRYIVASINKIASPGRQLLQATPRILLAIMIGIVISRPLELKIFDKEIKTRLKVNYLNGQRAKIDTLNAAFAKKYEIEFARMKQLEAQRDSLAQSIKTERQQLNYEIFGNKTAETSGRMGYGPYAKRKEQELLQRQQSLDSTQAQIHRNQTFMDQRKSFEGLMQEQILTSPQLDSLANIAGFADRNSALSQLKYKADGSKDESTGLAVIFIGLLFIFFECLPVFVKLMSPRGPYDTAIAQQESVSIYKWGKHHTEKTRIIDEVLEEKIRAGREKELYRIKKDLEDTQSL